MKPTSGQRTSDREQHQAHGVGRVVEDAGQEDVLRLAGAGGEERARCAMPTRLLTTNCGVCRCTRRTSEQHHGQARCPTISDSRRSWLRRYVDGEPERRRRRPRPCRACRRAPRRAGAGTSSSTVAQSTGAAAAVAPAGPRRVWAGGSLTRPRGPQLVARVEDHRLLVVADDPAHPHQGAAGLDAGDLPTAEPDQR